MGSLLLIDMCLLYVLYVCIYGRHYLSHIWPFFSVVSEPYIWVMCFLRAICLLWVVLFNMKCDNHTPLFWGRVSFRKYNPCNVLVIRFNLVNVFCTQFSAHNMSVWSLNFSWYVLRNMCCTQCARQTR